MEDNQHKGSWTRTYTGKAVTVLDPDPDQIDIVDIAWALSRMGRYNCHTPTQKLYSVAQHSVLVSHLCEPEDALWGLMHDATEAYVGDVVRPVKNQISGFQEIEDNVWRVIAKKYGIEGPMPDSVMHADNAILVIEARDLFGEDAYTSWGVPRKWTLPKYCPPIVPWDQKTSFDMYIKRFEELR